MNQLPVVYECATKAELQKQVTEVHKALVEYFKSTPDALFSVSPEPEGWSIEGNMKHIAQSNRFMGILVGMWRPFFSIFGKPAIAQPKPVEITPTNRKGISEFGSYPKGISLPCKNKDLLCEKILASAERLNAGIEKRTESELDTLCAPFGKMSLRTFVYFVLKHSIHHANIVKIRLQEK